MVNKRFSKDSHAAAPVIGQVLSMGIAVAIISAGGAAVLAQIDAPDATSDARFRLVLDCGALGWNSGDERVLLYHRGGPSYAVSELSLELSKNGEKRLVDVAARLVTSADANGGGLHAAVNLDTLALTEVDALADSDGDGFLDGAEANMGTDPMDPNSPETHQGWIQLLHNGEVIEVSGSAAAAHISHGDAYVPYGHEPDKRFGVGGAWVGEASRMRADAQFDYALMQHAADGSSTIIADGTLTDRVCGTTLTEQGVLRDLFGILPFVDFDCDGTEDPEDELLELSDFEDGLFTAHAGCLVIPAETGPIVANNIYLSAPGGVTVEVDLFGTNGPVQIVADNGPVKVEGISITGEDEVHISGETIAATNATLRSATGRVSLDSRGDILASGMSSISGSGAPSEEPEDLIDLPDQSGPGSIRFCIALLDANNHVTNGWQWHDRTFTVSGRGDDVPGYPIEGVLPPLTIQAPIPLNADLFYQDGIKDGYCVTYNDLELGGWFFDQGVVDDPTNWETSLHNDQNTEAIATVDDFFHYSPEIFDGDPSNDDERDTNADGHITLSNSRPYRTMVTLFRSTEARQPEVSIESQGGDIYLGDASLLATDSDVMVLSHGGDILGPGLEAHVIGDNSQVRMESEGGDIELPGSDLRAAAGQIHLLAGDGHVDLSRAAVWAMQDLVISGGGQIDLPNSVIFANGGNIHVAVNSPHTTIDQTGASIIDYDGAGSIVGRSDAVVVGTILEGDLLPL